MSGSINRADGAIGAEYRGPLSALRRASIASVGVVRIDFPTAYRTFLLKNVVAATGAAGSASAGELYVGFETAGGLSRSDTPTVDNIHGMVCALAYPKIRLERAVKTVYVAALAAQAGEELWITALRGDVALSGAAATAASAVTINGQPIDVALTGQPVSVKPAIADSSPTRSRGVVSVGTSDVEIRPSTPARTDLVIQNHGADALHVQYDAAAVADACPIIIPQYHTWSFREHGIVETGQIKAIRASGATTANVGYTEYT